MKKLEEHICFGGNLGVYEHDSATLGCSMKFSIFLPPQAQNADVPLLTFLSGLTCTHENFTHKAGAYGYAAKNGLAILAPDTSPRGQNVPDEEGYDFGKGAGFYIDATRAPWAKHYKMESYITGELNTIICETFPVLKERQGISGHSMGGHGALTLALKHPKQFLSLSAFAPIVAPSQVPWGEKAFTGYLSDDRDEWLNHDACALIEKAGNRSSFPEILIDQGRADSFLEEQLKPHLFEDVCAHASQSLNLRLHDGYDHSYYFIQSFIEDHIAHHVKILNI